MRAANWPGSLAITSSQVWGKALASQPMKPLVSSWVLPHIIGTDRPTGEASGKNGWRVRLRWSSTGPI